MLPPVSPVVPELVVLLLLLLEVVEVVEVLLLVDPPLVEPEPSPELEPVLPLVVVVVGPSSEEHASEQARTRRSAFFMCRFFR